MPLLNRVLSCAARVEFQPLWRALHRAALAGLGHMNTDPARNGEDRYLSEWAAAVSASPEPPVVLDIGANEGNFTARVLSLLDRVEVHCFEPNPATAARLAGRFAGDPRVTVNAVGAGDVEGRLRLYDHAEGRGSVLASFLPETFRDIYPAADTSAVEVPVTTIDAYAREKGIAAVAYAKVDVEGYERNVFLGMKELIAAGRIGRVQFEFNVHHAVAGLSLYQIRQLLDGADIHKLLPNGTEEVYGAHVPYHGRIEVYRYANYVAVMRRESATETGAARSP